MQTHSNKNMADKTIMENLHNYLPKDLVNIVEEYSKDRTNYDKVIPELLTYRTVFDIHIDYWDPHDFGMFFFKQLRLKGKRRDMTTFYQYCLQHIKDRQPIVNIDNLQN